LGDDVVPCRTSTGIRTCGTDTNRMAVQAVVTMSFKKAIASRSAILQRASDCDRTSIGADTTVFTSFDQSECDSSSRFDRKGVMQDHSQNKEIVLHNGVRFYKK